MAASPMSLAESLRTTEFTLERRFKSPPARVFAAWRDPEVKALWFRGPDTMAHLERQLDFRVGGMELLRGRTSTGIETLFTATYHAIAADAFLVYDYDMHHSGKHLSTSLASVTFAPEGTGCRMTFIEQAVYFDGLDGTASRKEGTNVHFDRLEALLDAN